MNTIMMLVGAANKELSIRDSKLGARTYNLYLESRKKDLCTTSTFLHMLADRSKKISEQNSSLRIVRETSDGIVVSGSRGLATLLPFTNQNLSVQLSQGPLGKGDEDFAFSFVVPVNSVGLIWVCRELHNQEGTHFDSPLSRRIDEMDCVAVFQECLIPWENVFIYRDIELFNKQPMTFRFLSGPAHQVLTRIIAKTRFIFGLAHLIAESSQINKFINVQERLGEIAIYLQTLEALSIAAIEGATQDPNNGLWYPNIAVSTTALRLYPEYYPQMMNHLLQLGASNYISMPQERTFEVLGQAIEDHFCEVNENAHDKVALFRIGWELAGSTWGSRQDLYERFFFGDPQQWKTRFYNMDIANKRTAIEMVKRLLQEPTIASQPFPLPDKFKG